MSFIKTPDKLSGHMRRPQESFILLSSLYLQLHSRVTRPYLLLLSFSVQIDHRFRYMTEILLIISHETWSLCRLSIHDCYDFQDIKWRLKGRPPSFYHLPPSTTGRFHSFKVVLSDTRSFVLKFTFNTLSFVDCSYGLYTIRESLILSGNGKSFFFRET